MSDGWIGVDLDRTLAERHDGDAYDPDHVGRPIRPMVRRVKEWLDKGKDVRIFTARAEDRQNHAAIKEWCEKHLGRELPITNVKDKDCREIWDDIAVGVYENEGIPIEPGRERAGDRMKKDLQKIAK